jgi:ATP-dependent DNA helicase RecQ
LNTDKAEFRPGQWEAIAGVAERRERLLLVQRTGWGKSIVYFLATRILRDLGAGPTIIVSPLLALMRNQVLAAERIRVAAATINSSNTEEWAAIRDSVLDDRVDALLISPERLGNDEFIASVLLPVAQRVGLLVIDEAHCISDWGHDFRPDYRRIVNLIARLPRNVPVLATTATANVRVVRDIESQVTGINVIRGSLARESLRLQNILLPDKISRLAWLAKRMDQLTGTGIIYVLTRRDADQVSAWLQDRGIEALPYYSNVTMPEIDDSPTARLLLEQKLLDNDLKALVATSALGMGFDKPDLGFVVHYQAPGSVIAYYQQVGRAGRALPSAHGILMTGAEDTDIHEFFRRSAFPPEDHVFRLLGALEEADGLSVRELEEAINLRYSQIEHVLKYLRVSNPAPVIKTGRRWYRTPTAYAPDRERIAFLTRQRLEEWEEMQRYLQTSACLMSFLRNALDDPLAYDCGRCANCDPSGALSTEVSTRTAVAAGLYLKHAEFKLSPRLRVNKGSFPASGIEGNLRRLDLAAEEGRVLSQWEDAGWGKIVAACKHQGHFADELVDAAAEMIDRWNPEPAPAWVTSVPSLTHTTLVPDFAVRLAGRLDLPYHEVVRKRRQNEAQKLMSNTFHQCRNIDGVFEVVQPVMTGPLLLVDDIVHSRWTFTLVAALLRQAGVERVFPVALASASYD